jgi:cytochrome c
MNLKSNIAFAALISAGLIAMVAGKVSQFLVSPAHPEKDAVTVEAAESSAAGTAVAAMPEPILALIAAADIERGKGVAKACAACHHVEKGGANGVGPGLYGVVGNKKQAHPGYAYSGVLDDQGGDSWTYEELNKFLWKPKAYNRDTKMTYVGIKKPEDRAALIAYLRSMDDSPEAEPSQAQIDKEQADLAPPEADTAAEAAGQASATPAEGAAAPGDKTPPAAKDKAVNDGTATGQDVKIAPGEEAKGEPTRN